MGTADILRASASILRRDGWWGNGGEPERRTARCSYLAIEKAANMDAEEVGHACVALAAYLGITLGHPDDAGDAIIDWNDVQPDGEYVAAQHEKAAAWVEETVG